MSRNDMFKLADEIKFSQNCIEELINMAPIWKPQDTKVYQDWIDTIFDEAESELNDWERKFLDNIQIWLNRTGKLSKDQAIKLEQIYTKLTK